MNLLAKLIADVPSADLIPGQLVDVDLRYALRSRVLQQDEYIRMTTSDPVLQVRRLLKDSLGNRTWTEWCDVRMERE